MAQIKEEAIVIIFKNSSCVFQLQKLVTKWVIAFSSLLIYLWLQTLGEFFIITLSSMYLYFSKKAHKNLISLHKPLIK